jgi:hypothetical protein
MRCANIDKNMGEPPTQSTSLEESSTIIITQAASVLIDLATKSTVHIDGQRDLQVCKEVQSLSNNKSSSNASSQNVSSQVPDAVGGQECKGSLAEASEPNPKGVSSKVLSTSGKSLPVSKSDGFGPASFYSSLSPVPLAIEEQGTSDGERSEGSRREHHVQQLTDGEILLSGLVNLQEDQSESPLIAEVLAHQNTGRWSHLIVLFGWFLSSLFLILATLSMAQHMDWDFMSLITAVPLINNPRGVFRMLVFPLSLSQAKSIDFAAGAIIAPILLANANFVWFRLGRTMSKVRDENPISGIDLDIERFESGSYDMGKILRLLKIWTPRKIAFAVLLLSSALASTLLSNALAYRAIVLDPSGPGLGDNNQVYYEMVYIPGLLFFAIFNISIASTTSLGLVLSARGSFTSQNINNVSQVINAVTEDMGLSSSGEHSNTRGFSLFAWYRGLSGHNGELEPLLPVVEQPRTAQSSTSTRQPRQSFFTRNSTPNYGTVPPTNGNGQREIAGTRNQVPEVYTPEETHPPLTETSTQGSSWSFLGRRNISVYHDAPVRNTTLPEVLVQETVGELDPLIPPNDCQTQQNAPWKARLWRLAYPKSSTKTALGTDPPTVACRMVVGTDDLEVSIPIVSTVDAMLSNDRYMTNSLKSQVHQDLRKESSVLEAKYWTFKEPESLSLAEASQQSEVRDIARGVQEHQTHLHLSHPSLISPSQISPYPYNPLGLPEPPRLLMRQGVKMPFQASRGYSLRPQWFSPPSEGKELARQYSPRGLPEPPWLKKDEDMEGGPQENTAKSSTPRQYSHWGLPNFVHPRSSIDYGPKDAINTIDHNNGLIQQDCGSVECQEYFSRSPKGADLESENQTIRCLNSAASTSATASPAHPYINTISSSSVLDDERKVKSQLKEADRSEIPLLNGSRQNQPVKELIPKIEAIDSINKRFRNQSTAKLRNLGSLDVEGNSELPQDPRGWIFGSMRIPWLAGSWTYEEGSEALAKGKQVVTGAKSLLPAHLDEPAAGNTLQNYHTWIFPSIGLAQHVSKANSISETNDDTQEAQPTIQLKLSPINFTSSEADLEVREIINDSTPDVVSDSMLSKSSSTSRLWRFPPLPSLRHSLARRPASQSILQSETMVPTQEVMPQSEQVLSPSPKLKTGRRRSGSWDWPMPGQRWQHVSTED